MNKSIIKNILLLVLLLGLGITSCDDRDDEITTLELERLFTPSKLESILKKEINLVLTWRNINGAESYVVELYNDSLVFDEANLVKKVEVTSNKFEYILEGDTRYSMRVKSLASNGKESKWSDGLTLKSGLNNIFLGQESGDITTDKAILRWPAGVNATKITLTSTDGNVISQDITAENIRTGVVTIEGLSPATGYTAILYNNEAKIGSTAIVTMSDGAIIIKPGDDLLAILTTAEDGSIFVVKAGEYLSTGEIVTISKSITIQGETKSNKPIIHGQLQIEKVASFTLADVILDGTKSDATLLDYALRFTSTEGTYGNISVTGCEIKNFNKSLIAAESAMKAVVETIEIDDCIVTNIQGNGGDGIDVRAGLIKNLKLTRSTFNKVTSSRDFIRLDDTSASFKDQISNILIDKCTFYKVCESKTRLLYVRFVSNRIAVKNSIFSQTAGYYTNQSKTADIDCSKNNYFKAPNFLVESAVASGAKYDTSGTHTTLDPSFEAPESGNFKVNNADVIVGDPRWFE